MTQYAHDWLKETHGEEFADSHYVDCYSSISTLEGEEVEALPEGIHSYVIMDPVSQQGITFVGDDEELENMVNTYEKVEELLDLHRDKSLENVLRVTVNNLLQFMPEVRLVKETFYQELVTTWKEKNGS